MSRITSFIQHYIKSNRGGHGVHSPFVYELATKVLTDNRDHEAYSVAENYIQAIKKDSQIIEHRELGAGDTKKKKFQVKQIAQKSAVPKKWGRLLHRLIKYSHPQLSVELGTSLGVGSLYMASAFDEGARLYTFEGSTKIAQYAEQQFERLGVSDAIHIFQGNIDDTYPPANSLIDKIDFAYIDANHKFTPTLKYFSWILEKSHPETLIVLDDIHWSHDMERAWKEIQKFPEVTLTVDLYRFGLVFLRQGQAKEHFRLWI